MRFFGYTFLDKILGRIVCTDCNGRGVIIVEKPPGGQRLERNKSYTCMGVGAV